MAIDAPPAPVKADPVKKRVSESIRKGMEFYPDVHHIDNDYFAYDNNGKVVGACAVGYAVLAEYGEHLNELNDDLYISKFEQTVPRGDFTLLKIIKWNDEEGLTPVEILRKLADG
jgi:hypothetical protein